MKAILIPNIHCTHTESKSKSKNCPNGRFKELQSIIAYKRNEAKTQSHRYCKNEKNEKATHEAHKKTKAASHYKRLDDIMTCRCSFTMIVTHLTSVPPPSSPTMIIATISHRINKICIIVKNERRKKCEPLNLNKQKKMK